MPQILLSLLLAAQGCARGSTLTAWGPSSPVCVALALAARSVVG